ncbi:hypothetical protein M514_09472 [Trichuris suis]|uniref:Uncharacterized protein n=1 Tax=Trichuris suis TaxID=68888 RepID=A0A085N9Z5_9BILA|nr:hypothetical protein M513_09472 [Trichuris suis]KFD66291.1 hypothetical protein M514_09472 [Trichuris suis]
MFWHMTLPSKHHHIRCLSRSSVSSIGTPSSLSEGMERLRDTIPALDFADQGCRYRRGFLVRHGDCFGEFRKRVCPSKDIPVATRVAGNGPAMSTASLCQV